MSDFRLGSGKFGTVYRVTLPYANYQVQKGCKGFDPQNKAYFKTFEKTYFKLKNRNLVKIMDANLRGDHITIIQEYCELGNLMDYMQSYCPNFDTILRIMLQCSSGLKFLHSQSADMLHGNVHPKNFLVKPKAGQHIIKVADCGLVQLFGGNATCDTVRKIHLITNYFTAPEILKDPCCSSQKMDVFALAVVFLAMLNFRPIDNDLVAVSDSSTHTGKLVTIGKELFDSILKSQTIPEVCSPKPGVENEQLLAVKQLLSVTKMFAPDPTNRSTIVDVHEELENIAFGDPRGMLSKGGNILSDETTSMDMVNLERFVSHEETRNTPDILPFTGGNQTGILKNKHRHNQCNTDQDKLKLLDTITDDEDEAFFHYQLPEENMSRLRFLNPHLWEQAKNFKFLKGQCKLSVLGTDLEKIDIDSLKGNNWIHDKIITAYIHLLCSKSEARIYVLEPFVGEEWQNGNFSKWMYEQVDFNDYDYVMLPVNDQYKHWILTAWNVPHKKLYVFDSLQDINRAKLYFSFWRCFIKTRNQNIQSVAQSKQIQFVVKGGYLQNDWNSCGVFVMMNADVWINTGERFLPQSAVQQYRKYIALQLRKNAIPNTTSKRCDLRKCARPANQDSEWLQCNKCTAFHHTKCVMRHHDTDITTPSSYTCLECRIKMKLA